MIYQVLFSEKKKKIKYKCITSLSSADFAQTETRVKQDKIIVANSERPRWNSQMGSLV